MGYAASIVCHTVGFFHLIRYPSVATSLLTVFTCSESVEGKSYLMNDLSVECYDSAHVLSLIFGCIVLMFYQLGLPLAIVFIMKYHPDSIVAKNLVFLKGLETFVPKFFVITIPIFYTF